MSRKTNKGKTLKAKSRRKRLERRLVAYAVTAGATAALTGQATEAEIVYTPGPFETGRGGLCCGGSDAKVTIDFDGDSAPEFEVIHHTFFSGGTCSFCDHQYGFYATLRPASGASNQSHGVADNSFPAALLMGEEVKPPYGLGGGRLRGYYVRVTYTSTSFVTGGTVRTSGNFNTSDERFVGVKFDLRGATVFGWIGVEVKQFISTTTVTGYAYEDTGKRIRAGQTIPEPSPLALLALGATGIAALRRRKDKKPQTEHSPA